MLKVKSINLSPSRTDSSTPVITTVWVVFQLEAVKTSVVVERLTSAVFGLLISRVTFEAGFRSKITSIEAVTVPDSLTVIKLVGVTL